MRFARSLSLLAATTLVACAAPTAARPTTHAALAELFTDWRAFQAPVRVSGIPDYRADAMDRQHRALAGFRARLAAFDTTGWSIADQVDWHLIRAEMNGLDFDHRVLRPWERNPGFYVTFFNEQSDQPAREGPWAWGAVELWAETQPLSSARAAAIDSGVRRIPALLAQARGNLTGDGADLWRFGAKAVAEQAAALAAFDATLEASPLKTSVQRARAASDSFAQWVTAQVPNKHAPSGIGEANYDWYLKHVQLVPLTYREEKALIERELGRAQSFLALEEARNRAVPAQVPVASAEEHARRFGAAVTSYVEFLRSHDLYPVQPWTDSVLRQRIGSFTPGPREFFTEVDYRDPMVMRTHGYHWIDLGWMEIAPHKNPIRRGPLLYNIFNTRTEGHATGWEEMMLQAGMFDAQPRSRELIYVLLGQRAARALGELLMHGEGASLEEAAQFAVAHTPRGWLRSDANTVRFEQHLYLAQPGYGTSYVIGKWEIERLFADLKRRQGDAFALRPTMAAFDAAGLIPASLLRWEMTGSLPPETAAMLHGR
ncbi:MAG: DUF885 domain-containing protein [Gemmatimonadaceae bacterium]|nr:DUF885 domain-containing protein [Gemmatimonadaceae bacterium]